MIVQKMCEALSDASYAMFNFLKTQNGGYEEMANAFEKVKAALYEPMRNCDRFADELDAQLAFLNEVWLISVDRETMLERDKYENWSDEMRTVYGRWLLAQADERKGEGDESK